MWLKKSGLILVLVICSCMLAGSEVSVDRNDINRLRLRG